MERAEFRAVDFGAVYADLAQNAGGPARGRPYTLVNMVSTLDGKATAGGKAGKLGTPTDRLMMRKIRGACDALAYGAGTLRVETVDPRVPEEMAEQRKARGLPPQPVRVVFSNTGELPLKNLFFRAGEAPLAVFTTEAVPAAAVTVLRGLGQVFLVGEVQVDLRRAMATLAGELGIGTMVAEGGPMLTYSLVREGLVDELLVTLTPRIAGGQGAKTIAEGPELWPALPEGELASVHREGSELYLRYRFK